MNKSNISFNITLDENKVPEEIKWKADENGQGEAKAIMLSIWDDKEKNTLKIDLWNKEMTTDEMKQFFHQSILVMTDTFERATDDKETAEGVRMFCEDLKERLKI